MSGVNENGEAEVSVNEPPVHRGPQVSWATIALDSVFWAYMAFTTIGCGLSWMDRANAVPLPASLALWLIVLAPVAAVLTVVACHRGWFHRQPAS